MQPDSQEPQTNPVQTDTTPPQVFPTPQDPQNPPVPTSFVNPAPEQVQPTVSSPATATVSPEPVAHPVVTNSMPSITPPNKSHKKTVLVSVIVLVLVIVGGGAFVFYSSKHQTKPAKTQTQSLTSNATQWPITSPDGSAHLYDISSLATTSEQASVVKTLSLQCVNQMGAASAGGVVVDSDNKDFFNGGKPPLFISSGNFVKAEVGCANKNTTSTQASDDYAKYLNSYILEQKGNTWNVVITLSNKNYCSAVDHIAIPPSILPVCIDQTTKQERAPLP